MSRNARNYNRNWALFKTSSTRLKSGNGTQNTIGRLSSSFRGGELGGVQSTGVSQRVRATGRDESQSVPSPEKKKLFKTRDLELPFFEGSLPSCSPHSVGYTCTSLHPCFPVAKCWSFFCRDFVALFSSNVPCYVELFPLLSSSCCRRERALPLGWLLQ